VKSVAVEDWIFVWNDRVRGDLRNYSGIFLLGTINACTF
jgi:hypothetical protein